jgi:hypothetical protein
MASMNSGAIEEYLYHSGRPVAPTTGEGSEYQRDSDWPRPRH